MTAKASRIVLALPMDDAVLGAALRRELPVQVAWETPYFNRTVLMKVQSLSPDIVIVSEALPGDGDLSLVAFVRGLRQHNIRVIFLADTSHPGDPILSDLVAMNVTDILLEGEVELTKLSHMLEQQTPWSQVAHLLRPGSSVRLPAATAPPEPKETVREVVVERVVTVEKLVTVPAPGRSQRVLTVMGLGPEGAGVTTVAINLAAVLAANGHLGSPTRPNSRGRPTGTPPIRPMNCGGRPGTPAARWSQTIGSTVV